MAAPKIIRHSALYAGGEMGAKLLLMAAVVYWMTHLSPAEFGTFEVVRSVFVLLAVPLGMGLSAAAGRWFVDLDESSFRGLLSSSVAAILVLSAVVFALALLLPDVAFGSDDSAMLWLFGIGCATASAAQTPLRSTLVIQSRAGAHTSVVVVQAAVTVGVATWLLVNRGGGALPLVIGYLAGFGSSAIVAGLLARDNLGLVFDREQLYRGLAYGLPLIPHLLAHQVMTSADRLILERLEGRAPTGIYGAAYLFASALTVVALSLNKATLPAVFGKMQFIVQSEDGERTTAQRELAELFTSWLMVICWLAVSAALLSPEVLLVAMKPEYHAAAPVIFWVVWGSALHAAYLIPVNSLLYRQRNLLISSVSIGSALLNVVLNFVLIPPLGILGAALATLIAYAALSLGIWAFASRELGGARRQAWITRAIILATAIGGSYALLEGLASVATAPRVAIKIATVVALTAAVGPRALHSARRRL